MNLGSNMNIYQQIRTNRWAAFWILIKGRCLSTFVLMQPPVLPDNSGTRKQQKWKMKSCIYKSCPVLQHQHLFCQIILVHKKYGIFTEQKNFLVHFLLAVSSVPVLLSSDCCTAICIGFVLWIFLCFILVLAFEDNLTRKKKYYSQEYWKILLCIYFPALKHLTLSLGNLDSGSVYQFLID